MKKKAWGSREPYDYSFIKDRLGVIEDRILSKESGIPITRLRCYRFQHGISAKWSRKRKES